MHCICIAIKYYKINITFCAAYHNRIERNHFDEKRKIFDSPLSMCVCDLIITKKSESDNLPD